VLRGDSLLLFLGWDVFLFFVAFVWGGSFFYYCFVCGSFSGCEVGFCAGIVRGTRAVFWGKRFFFGKKAETVFF